MTYATLDLGRPDDPILADPDTIVRAQAAPALDVNGYGRMEALGYRAARAQLPDWIAIRHREMVEDFIDKAAKRSGAVLANPFAATEYEESRELARRVRRGEDIRGMTVSTRETRLADFEAKAFELRERFPDLPDPRTFRDTAREELRKRVRELSAAQTTATGLGDIGAIVGGVGAEILHPVNLMTLPLGAPAAFYAPARFGIVAAMARVGLIESGIATASQAVIGAEKMGRLPGLGVPYDWGDFAEELGGAAAAGFVLGAGFRGIVGAGRGIVDLARDWRAARARLGERVEAIPPAERQAADDGATVGERLAMDAERNPFGQAGAEAHARASAAAYVDAAAGRGADVAEIVRNEVARIAEERPAAPPTLPKAQQAERLFSPDTDRALYAADVHEPRSALREVEAEWRDLRDAIDRGAVDPRMDLTPAVKEGAALVAEARKSGRGIADVIEERRPSLEAQAFALMMHENGFGSPIARPDVIAARLRSYIDEAHTVAPDSEFAGAAAPLAILDRIVSLQRAIARRIEAEAQPDAAGVAQLDAAIMTRAKAEAGKGLEVPVGVDAEGRAIMRPAADVLREARADEIAAQRVVACAIGNAL